MMGKNRAVWAIALSGLLLAGQALAKPRNFQQEHVPGQMIVKFKPGLSSITTKQKLKDAGLRWLHTFSASGAMLVETTARRYGYVQNAQMLDTQLLQAAHRLDSALVYSEANTILHLSAKFPNDARFGELYGLHNEGANNGKVGASVHAPEAWDISTGSRNVLVGIIDTGVDYKHPDIAANYWTNPGESGLDAQGRDKRSNGVDDDGNGYIDDWRGWDFANNDNDPLDDHDHGTHVAGTIGAHGDDGVGVVGVNWQVSLVGLKFLRADGSGTLDAAVRAIEYANKIGVTLTSNSWGGGGYSAPMEAAIRQANERGILFIAAAGNDAANNDVAPHFPSSYELDNVISVAATDNTDTMADFSCYGAQTVDVAAPGVDILSSVKGGGYAQFSGTSMATPHVSGVAALIKAAYPDATAAQIKARILNTVDQVPSLRGKLLTGGRVNAFNALENDSLAPNAAQDLRLEAAGLSSVSLSWQASGDDGDVGQASRYEVRYADAAIESEEAWAKAKLARVEAVLGSDGRIQARVSDLALGSSGYLAVKAVDNVGNFSSVSATIAFAVKQIRQISENRADNLNGVTTQAPWGLETLADEHGSVFSDSPAGNYASNADTSLTFAAVGVDTQDVLLQLDATYDLESDYDHARLEISIDDGNTWSLLESFTGVSAWATHTYDLSSFLKSANHFQLRLHVTADDSIEHDGIKLDNLRLFAPEAK